MKINLLVGGPIENYPERLLEKAREYNSIAYHLGRRSRLLSPGLSILSLGSFLYMDMSCFCGTSRDISPALKFLALVLIRSLTALNGISQKELSAVTADIRS